MCAAPCVNASTRPEPRCWWLAGCLVQSRDMHHIPCTFLSLPQDKTESVSVEAYLQTLSERENKSRKELVRGGASGGCEL